MTREIRIQFTPKKLHRAENEYTKALAIEALDAVNYRRAFYEKERILPPLTDEQKEAVLVRLKAMFACQI